MMDNKAIFAAAAVLAAVSACSKSGPSTNETQTGSRTQADQSGQVYSGSGTISAIAGDQVSIDHGPIKGIGWPAMTMTFTAPAALATGVRVGDKADFSFRKDGSAYVLTSLQKRRA